MTSPDTTDAPLVPFIESHEEAYADGGTRRPPERPYDRPPETDHSAEYTRDAEEIEPFVADLR